MTAIATFGFVALDSPDAETPARFYGATTGWDTDHADVDWVRLRAPGGGTTTAFPVEGHRPPVWPGTEHPRQAHPDLDVPDLDVAEEKLLAIGARKHAAQPGTSFRVYLDPAGHPFYLVPA